MTYIIKEEKSNIFEIMEIIEKQKQMEHYLKEIYFSKFPPGCIGIDFAKGKDKLINILEAK